MRVLQITTSWPSSTEDIHGNFIYRQTQAFLNAGIEIETFAFRGKKNPVNYLKAWLEVRMLLKRMPFDLILCQFGQSSMIAFPSKTPVIVCLHGSDILGIPDKKGKYTLTGKIMTKAVKYSLRKSDGIIGVSKEVISKIQSLNKPKVILPMGVDLSKFKPIPKQEACNQLGLSPEKKYIFFPSNPERPVKNFTLAKLAFDLLTREDVNLLIAKNIPPDKMWLYYNAADIVLVTSFHEGSPNVIKEAMACNTPIISVNVGDVSERFRNSIYGNSVVPYDPYKMAEQMEHYLQSEKRSDGRKIVSEISEDKIIEMSILFFESIVKSYNNRPSF